MTASAPEELRRAALEALGEHADGRARDTLAHATLAITPSVSRWEGSAGTVEGHAVVLVLDAARLGAVRATPAILDALHAAISSAIARSPGETLHELSLRWAPGVVVAEGYRDAPRAEGLAEALAAYLRASGEGAVASRLEGVAVVRRPSEVQIALPDDPHVRDVVTQALRDLLGGDAVRLVLRQ